MPDDLKLDPEVEFYLWKARHTVWITRSWDILISPHRGTTYGHDEVQKAVRGNYHEMHHVEAFGLIDRDDRDGRGGKTYLED